MILKLRVQIPQWDVGADPSYETVKPRSRVAAGVARKRAFAAKSYYDKHRSKFAENTSSCIDKDIVSFFPSKTGDNT
jgi:hypothetical protein